MLTRTYLKVARHGMVGVYPVALQHQPRLRRYNSTNTQRSIGTAAATTTTTTDTATPPRFKFKFKFGSPNGGDTQTQGTRGSDMVQGRDKPSANRWAAHAMPSKQVLEKLNQSIPSEGKNENIAAKELSQAENPSSFQRPLIEEVQEPKQVEASTIKSSTPATAASNNNNKNETKKRRKRTIRPRKAIITLSPNAVSHLKQLLNQPTPQLLKSGHENRGCSGTVYDLQYITEPGKYDEVVEQDGVKIVVDSKALFSVVGSEMDWVDDKLQSKFVFRDPNSKGTCGCGESFML